MFISSSLLVRAFFLQHIINTSSKFINFIFEVSAFFLNILYFHQHFGLALFCLKSFSHTISYGTFIQGLVSLNCHFDFISNTNKQETSLSTVYCNLSNDFIKRLRIEFLSDRTNTCLSGLSLL